MTDRQEKSIAEKRYAVAKEGLWLAAGAAATVWVVIDPVGNSHHAAAVGLAGIAMGHLVCSFAEAVLVYRRAELVAAGEDGGGCGTAPDPVFTEEWNSGLYKPGPY